MTLALRYLAHSEVGLVRKNNQDSAYASPTMLMVADGMGGAAAGDLASAIAITQIAQTDTQHITGEAMLPAIDDAITRASDLINDVVHADPNLDGMGSTLCGVMFDGEKLALANVGDSRAYRYRDGQLSRLSRDHSWVQTLVDDGRITEAEALEHPHRSLILKVINGQPQHTPDLKMVEVAAGDRLMICSDGLCGMVTDQVIAARMDGSREDVMDALVKVAHAEGGQDNITIIIADVVEGEPEGDPQTIGSAALIDDDDLFDEATLIQRLAPMRADPRPEPQTPEVARYAPTGRRRGLGWLRILLVALVPLLLIGAGGFLWYSYTQEQYYVGPNGDYVGVFQGIAEPAFHLPLSHLVEADDTRIADLPPYYQEQVRATLPASSLDSARATVVMLQTKAAECILQRQQWHNPPSASPSPSATPSAHTTPSGKPGSASPSPSATPSPTPSQTSTSSTEC